MVGRSTPRGWLFEEHCLYRKDTRLKSDRDVRINWYQITRKDWISLFGLNYQDHSGLFTQDQLDRYLSMTDQEKDDLYALYKLIQ